MQLESIATRAWRRLSKIAHSETTVATANGQGIELAEYLQMAPFVGCRNAANR
jgi:hypothetical protein